MAVLITIYLVLCLAVGVFGRRRAMGFFGSLFFSLILTPIVVMAVLLLAAPRPKVKVAASN